MPDMTTNCPTCGEPLENFCDCNIQTRGGGALPRTVAEIASLTARSKPNQSSPAAADALREWPRTDAIFNLLQICFGSETDYEHFVAAKEGARCGVEALETELATALAGRASQDAEIAGLRADVQNLRIAVDQVKSIARYEEDRLTGEKNDLFDALQSECEASKALRAEVETLRKELSALTSNSANSRSWLGLHRELTKTAAERDTLTAQLAEAKAEAANIIETGHRYGHAGDTAMAVYLSATNEIDDKAEEIRALEASLTAAQTLAGELAGALEAMEAWYVSQPSREIINLNAPPTIHQWYQHIFAALTHYRAQQRPTAQEAE